MLTIRQFVLVALLFLPILSGTDCRWCRAIEFWSNVVCSMENSKTVHFHAVLDNNKSSMRFEQCFEAFVYSIARKCLITTVLKTYSLTEPENVSFIDENDVIYESVKRPSIFKITSKDEFPFQVTSTKIEKIQSDKAFGENTWNIHVILATSVRSFDQISKDSTFEWKPYDRFIVLIACREKMLNKSRLNGILKTLWFKHKVQSVLVTETIAVVNNTRTVRTFNPFAKVNDTVYGQVEIINVKTAEETSSLLSHFTWHRTNNMNEYELKMGSYSKSDIDLPNYSVPAEDELDTHSENNYNFKDLDDMILNALAERMNFTSRWVLPTDNQHFGYQLANGTYTGALAHTGDVVYGRTDICFESFYIKKYSIDAEEDVDFSVYMNFDRVCVIVPKATEIPKGLRFYHFFPPLIWICSMLSQIFVYLTWYFLQIFNPKRTEKISLWATIYRSFLLNAGCPQKLPNANAERILLSGLLLSNIPIAGLFSGILYNSFARDMYYPDIETLQELDASGLLIALASYWPLDDLFDDEDNSTLMRSLRSKIRYGENAVPNAAYYRNGSGFAKESYFPSISINLSDTDGKPLIHMVKECPGAFFLTYLLPKNSILQEAINTWIGRLNQVGLTQLWNKRTIQYVTDEARKLSKQNRLTQNGKETMGFVPFNLSDMQSSFYMLLIGLLVSAIVFLHEKGWLRSR